MEYAEDVAKAIMKIQKNVKTVLAQTSPVDGKHRTKTLAFVKGEKRTNTVHRENGCLFSVDLRKCYFSPRLSYERMRFAKLVSEDEIVVNMFAGVGCFSIIIAKHLKQVRVFSIDINPDAIDLMQRNVRLNYVYGKVIPLLGDAKIIIRDHLGHVADRVLMPLPQRTFEYLSHAIYALKEKGGYIHYYGFEHAEKYESPIEKVKGKVVKKLTSLNIDFDIPFSRIVRSIGPNWHQVVLDLHFKQLH